MRRIDESELLLRFDEHLNEKYATPADALSALAENQYLKAYDEWLESQDMIMCDGGDFFEMDYDHDYDMER